MAATQRNTVLQLKNIIASTSIFMLGFASPVIITAPITQLASPAI